MSSRNATAASSTDHERPRSRTEELLGRHGAQRPCRVRVRVVGRQASPASPRPSWPPRPTHPAPALRERIGCAPSGWRHLTDVPVSAARFFSCPRTRSSNVIVVRMMRNHTIGASVHQPALTRVRSIAGDLSGHQRPSQGRRSSGPRSRRDVSPRGRGPPERYCTHAMPSGPPPGAIVAVTVKVLRSTTARWLSPVTAT